MVESSHPVVQLSQDVSFTNIWPEKRLIIIKFKKTKTRSNQIRGWNRTQETIWRTFNCLAIRIHNALKATEMKRNYTLICLTTAIRSGNNHWSCCDLLECMYVCMYNVCICMYVWMYECMHMNVCMCAYECMYMSIYAFLWEEPIREEH